MRYKYPKTFHVPWSPHSNNRDLKHTTMSYFYKRPVVVTEKMDGENTTLYRDGLHARSIDSANSNHPSRDWVKAVWGTIRHDIPEGMRICGENLYAKHSIYYNNLPSYFMVFNIWKGDKCLNWAETIEWCDLLNLNLVPVLYHGLYDEKLIHDIWTDLPYESEGYVIRIEEEFYRDDFWKSIAKYVRPNHVQTTEHWLNKDIIPNGLAI